MSIWLKLAITLAAMLLTSLLAGQVWRWMFTADLPGYLSGVAGGISAVVAWELLKKYRPGA